MPAFLLPMSTISSSFRGLASGIPVLLYHRLVEDHLYPSIPPPENIFSLPQSRFKEQLEYLAQAGYKALDLQEFEEILNGRAPVPERAVLITFDDGCESVYRLAAPLLARYRMPAAVFVTTDESCAVFQMPYSQRRLSIDEMRALEHQGIRCESHGVTHAGLCDLDDHNLQRELSDSKRNIQEIVEREISALALPLNGFNGRVLRQAHATAYRMIFSSTPGFTKVHDDPMLLKRIMVEGGASIEEFRRSLTAAGLLQRRFLSWVKRFPPRLMGYRLWMPLRQRLFSSPMGRFLTPASLRRLILIALFLAAVTAVGALTLALIRLSAAS